MSCDLNRDLRENFARKQVDKNSENRHSVQTVHMVKKTRLLQTSTFRLTEDETSSATPTVSVVKLLSLCDIMKESNSESSDTVETDEEASDLEEEDDHETSEESLQGSSSLSVAILSQNIASYLACRV